MIYICMCNGKKIDLKSQAKVKGGQYSTALKKINNPGKNVFL